MKKIIALLVVLCLLSAFAANAADAGAGVGWHGREGLDFIAMEDRHALADDQTFGAMQWAYETIHQTNHFGEMAAKGHLMGVGADINAALKAMNLSFTAYDYLIYDAFELQLQEGYAALLENGAQVDVCFDMNLERSVHPVVLLSSDQAAWRCIDPANVRMNADGSLSVAFDELGTVLVLVEVERRLPGGSDYSGSFTPSVTGKAAPDVIAPDAADPATIALIFNEAHELISRVPDAGYLVITPLSRRDVAEDMQVRQRLEWAYNQIRTTPRIGDLTGLNGMFIAGKIDAQLEAAGFGDLSSDDLIVRDLFDASLYGTEYLTAMNGEGHYIEIIFDLKVNPNDPLVILLTNDNQTWQVLSREDYEIHADGTVTLRLEQLGAIAVLVDAKNPASGAVKSPKTGE